MGRHLKKGKPKLLSEPEMKIDTRTLAHTAALSALVIVFDYALKFSNLKIRFPWLPFLKFDFTGIPIVLAFLLFGFVSGATTSVIAFVGILARSGDVIGASMKGLAELSTVLGMALGLWLLRDHARVRKHASFVFGIASRSCIMVCTNLLLVFTGVLALYGSYAEIPVVVSLLVGAFNAAQGFLSMLGGYLIYEALIHRIPSLASGGKDDRNH
ncbi:MAG: hypothetical protein NWF14_05455 [Candidatus Bathyarchaeota archaeon]|nr:hypothetical protein [Candidatus Bathyarchaeota archaeon]